LNGKNKHYHGFIKLDMQAYNLMKLVQREGIAPARPEAHAEIDSMLSFLIPGKPIETGIQLIIKPVSGYPYQGKYLLMDERVEELVV